jgi:hypothetical protein
MAFLLPRPGVKASYPFTSRITAELLLTNGCDAVKDLNGSVTVGGQLAVVPSKTTNLTFNLLHGAEQPHNAHDQRSVYELTGAWKVVPQFVLGIDALYADEDHAAKDGSDALWKGVAGYAQYLFTKNLSLAFRGEVFADCGGSRTGTSQTLRGFTLTPQYALPAKLSRLNSEFKHLDGRFVIRADFRKDFSDQNTFQKGTGYANQQYTTAVNLIYLF